MWVPPVNTNSLGALFPPLRVFAADVIFAIALGSRTDEELGRRWQSTVLRRRLVRLEQARRTALDSDSLPIP